MLLNDKFHLCYIDLKNLFLGIKEKQLSEENFLKEKNKGKKTIENEICFFSDTELLLVFEDNVFLKTLDFNHSLFLAKNYKLDYQHFCQKFFQEKKNLIIISDEQGNGKDEKNKAIVLYKDKENIKISLENWLEKLKSS